MPKLRIAVALPLSLALLAVLGASPAAQAAPAPYTVQLVVINKKTVATNYINFSNELARCAAVTAGIGCTISQGVSSTRTIQLDLGASRGLIAGSFGFSSANTLSTSVNCSSPPLAAGQTLRAYPIGTRYSYQILKRHNPGGLTWVTLDTSPTLYAFNPSVSVACAVR